MNVEDTLRERGDRYGDFAEQARIAQALSDVIRTPGGWHRLTPAMRYALELIQFKIARILNGDPTYADNWHDIIGYARLIEKTLMSPVHMTNAEAHRDRYRPELDHCQD